MVTTQQQGMYSQRVEDRMAQGMTVSGSLWGNVWLESQGEGWKEQWRIIFLSGNLPVCWHGDSLLFWGKGKESCWGGFCLLNVHMEYQGHIFQPQPVHLFLPLVSKVAARRLRRKINYFNFYLTRFHPSQCIYLYSVRFFMIYFYIVVHGGNL